LANSAIASSASTPPVMVIGANGALAATSALEIMIWSILLASCCTEAANTSRPIWHQMIAPMHIARAVRKRRGAMVGETAAYRHHFTVRGRVAIGLAEIAAVRDHLAVAHDDRAERKIAPPRLIDRQSHEALVIGGCVGGARSAACRENRGRCEARDHAAAARKRWR
jgi:hypothetical protein